LHVLQAIIEGLERLIRLDVLVQVGVCLLGSHVTALLNETISVNGVPKGLFPGVKLVVNEADEIPVFLEADEVVFALIKLLEL